MDERYRFDLDEPCCRCLNNQGSDRKPPCLHCKWNVGAEAPYNDYFQIIPGDQYEGKIPEYIAAVESGII